MQIASGENLNTEVKQFDTETFIFRNRKVLLFGLLGIIFIGLGAIFYKDGWFDSNKSVEVIEDAEVSLGTGKIIVEVAGAVEKPGVYEFKDGDRVEDLLIAAGGISADADRVWMEKMLNRAAKLIDGQKLYIKRQGEQSEVLSAKNNGGYQTVSVTENAQGSGLININVASAKELESMWGIGPVYAQYIIEQRPYSNVEELLSKGVIKENVYERNKNIMTVY